MNTIRALFVGVTALVLAMVPLTPRGQAPEPLIEPELLGTWYRDFWMGVCVATQTDDVVAKLVQLVRYQNQLNAQRKMEINSPP